MIATSPRTLLTPSAIAIVTVVVLAASAGVSLSLSLSLSRSLYLPLTMRRPLLSPFLLFIAVATAAYATTAAASSAGATRMTAETNSGSVVKETVITPLGEMVDSMSNAETNTATQVQDSMNNSDTDAAAAAAAADLPLSNDNQESPDTALPSQFRWTTCDIFLAPSSLPGAGWGVFAARDFAENEVVEVAPMFLPFPPSQARQQSAIADYIYGYIHKNMTSGQDEILDVAVFGMSLFYNHHENNNIEWRSFGSEPSADYPRDGRNQGYGALRDIKAGEELFTTYGKEDGGKKWFAERDIDLKVLPQDRSRKYGKVLELDRAKYCSKVHAGAGQSFWKERILPGDANVDYDLSRTHVHNKMAAVASQAVRAGDVLEMAPALTVHRDVVEGSIMSPFAIYWEDLRPSQQQSMRELRASLDLKVQFQAERTKWKRTDGFRYFEDVVLLPFGGRIGMVYKVGEMYSDGRYLNDEDFEVLPNCELQIVSTGSMQSSAVAEHGGGDSSAGILLKLVATRDIPLGAELRLNLVDRCTVEEKDKLLKTLMATGQPYTPQHFVIREEDAFSADRHEWEEEYDSYSDDYHDDSDNDGAWEEEYDHPDDKDGNAVGEDPGQTDENVTDEMGTTEVQTDILNSKR